jgi:hypothetical protein
MPHSVRRMHIDGPGRMRSARYDSEVRSNRCYSNLTEGEPQNNDKIRSRILCWFLVQHRDRPGLDCLDTVVRAPSVAVL